MACSTGWEELGGAEVIISTQYLHIIYAYLQYIYNIYMQVNTVVLAKISPSLQLEWSQTHGLAGGHSQVSARGRGRSSLYHPVQ